MRKEVILGVADAIEKAELAKYDIGFNMRHLNNIKAKDHTGHQCGTSCCIAGWIHILYDENGNKRTKYGVRKNLNNQEHRSFAYGAKAMDIDLGTAVDLFWPYSMDYNELTSKQAVKVLRNFAETGKVDWHIRS